MKPIAIDEQARPNVIAVLGEVSLFKSLPAQHLETILKHAEFVQYESDETILAHGETIESLILIIEGEVSVFIQSKTGARKALLKLGSGSTLGEIAVLLKKPALVTGIATNQVRALHFKNQLFLNMFDKIPNFGLALSRNLAERLEEVSGQVSLPQFKEKKREWVRRVTDLLPVTFLQRHRVLPVRLEKDQLTIGFVGEPTSAVLDAIYKLLPGMVVHPVRIHSEYFNGVLRARAGVTAWQDDGGSAPKLHPKLGAELNTLLERMVAEGASDLHISEGESPRWRIDGDLLPIKDAPPFPAGKLLRQFEPAMEGRHQSELSEKMDTDFGYSLDNMARFRINLFRDYHGTGASIRQIPANIMNIDLLSHADNLKRMATLPNGLILITGPTGSGKSTTLAAMVDYINQQQSRHIITIEDPIEFIHKNQKSVVNQREIGGHTPSFKRGLRAALREDPDVVLVGEILDLETMNLVLETASTGHLVFSTLHTRSAVTTIDRIIDLYPPHQQQHVRTSVSDTLVGVVSQTLCKRKVGGRIAAFEMMIVNKAITNLIREGKAIQIPSIMQAGKRDGQILLNDSLAHLVAIGEVDVNEALLKTIHREDLLRRLKKPPA